MHVVVCTKQIKMMCALKPFYFFLYLLQSKSIIVVTRAVMMVVGGGVTPTLNGHSQWFGNSKTTNPAQCTTHRVIISR